MRLLLGEFDSASVIVMAGLRHCLEASKSARVLGMFRLSASPHRCSLALALALASVPAFCQTVTPAAPPAAAAPELRVFDPALIDKTVDPCENFYRYSCNGWFKRNPLPADQTSYGRFTELAALNRRHPRQVLAQAAV